MGLEQDLKQYSPFISFGFGHVIPLVPPLDTRFQQAIRILASCKVSFKENKFLSHNSRTLQNFPRKWQPVAKRSGMAYVLYCMTPNSRRNCKFRI